METEIYCVLLALFLLCIVLCMSYETYGSAATKKKKPVVRPKSKNQTTGGYQGNIVTFWGVDPNQLQIAGSGKQF